VTRIFGGGPNQHAHLIRVTDLYSATLVLGEIVDQGEGSAHTEYAQDDELAHFWQLSQIVDGTIALRDADVYPVVADPKIAALPPGPLQDLCQLFSGCYCLLLRALNRIYSIGDKCELIQQGTIYALMNRVLWPIGSILAATPIPGTEFNVGPSFELTTATQAEIIRKAASLAEAFPPLEGPAHVLVGLPEID
jgi:hypothetical protein